MKPAHLLHSVLTDPPSANARRLKSRHPFVPIAQHLISLSEKNRIRAAHRADPQWNVEWADKPARLRNFHLIHRQSTPRDDSQEQLGSGETASALVSDVYAPVCTKGEWPPLRPVNVAADEQTVGHVVVQCPIHRPPHVLCGLAVLDDGTMESLLNTVPRSSAAKQWFEL